MSRRGGGNCTCLRQQLHGRTKKPQQFECGLQSGHGSRVTVVHRHWAVLSLGATDTDRLFFSCLPVEDESTLERSNAPHVCHVLCSSTVVRSDYASTLTILYQSIPRTASTQSEMFGEATAHLFDMAEIVAQVGVATRNPDNNKSRKFQKTKRGNY